MSKLYCGFIAIIGRPNVGKSTLMNQILQKKISITSKKPQTTRHRLNGIKTEGNHQMVYVDTPGLHDNAKQALNKSLNLAATNALSDVDIVIFVVEALNWTEKDNWVLKKLQNLKCPVILAINKVDKIKRRETLLPFIQGVNEKFAFKEVVPMSAEQNTNIEALEKIIKDLLPENPHFFPVDKATDRDEQFLVQEIVREKLTRFLGDELPYVLTVQVEKYQVENAILHIHALIWVERAGHKAIVVGKGGERLKKISTQARLDIEKLLARKVFLKVWVKDKPGWTNDKEMIRKLGYE